MAFDKVCVFAGPPSNLSTINLLDLTSKLESQPRRIALRFEIPGESMRALWMIFCVFTCWTLNASSWHYLRESKTSIYFFDSDSVKVQGATLQYWVKALTIRDLDRAFTKRQDVAEQSAIRLHDGYIPYLLRLDNARAKVKDFKQSQIALISYEIEANICNIQPRSRFLWEVDTRTKMAACISLTVWDAKRKPTTTNFDDPRWDNIAPDTSFDLEFELLNALYISKSIALD